MTVLPRLRAPQDDGAVFAEPPLGQASALLAGNRERLAEGHVSILDQSLAELRKQARNEALATAREYLEQAGEPVLPNSEGPLFLAGHQPELFHPGVWVKSFALAGLARAHSGASINLIVDNDTVKHAALRMPSVEPGAVARIVAMPFDRPSGEVPYEERPVRDEAEFAAFPEQAAKLFERWNFRPMLPAFWEEACRHAKRTPLLGERLAAARRTLERRWGCHNLELPVSRLCRTQAFARFACHVLTELPRFHMIYNQCVREYRQRYGIRSRNHPVPDLAEDGGWRETPFWAWRAGHGQRGRLLARIADNRIELRVGAESWPSLPRKGPDAVTTWQGLEKDGYKVRSRALTTTLFARLFVADLFLHGIGGAKYDELNDEIIRRFYGLEPPRFLVLSATLLLPFAAVPVRPESRRQLARDLRDLHYNPQRHLGNGELTNAVLAELAARKRDWIQRQPSDRRSRHERFLVLRDLTHQLRSLLPGREQNIQQQLVRCEQELEANAVLQRRDYAFCLYPEEKLRPFCTRFLNVD